MFVSLNKVYRNLRAKVRERGILAENICNLLKLNNKKIIKFDQQVADGVKLQSKIVKFFYDFFIQNAGFG